MCRVCMYKTYMRRHIYTKPNQKLLDNINSVYLMLFDGTMNKESNNARALT